MAKFTSFDGVDKNGMRAEVNVQVGTGRVKEIVGRGQQADDGSYRNVEVVFDPDNPLLKRKVYALLDTTAKDLAEYAQAALSDQRTVSFRIESQRKRGVDRAKKFEDLDYMSEVIRVLAGLDNVFSHEAKTDPAEDPTNENPSALDQHRAGMPAAAAAGEPGTNRDTVLAALAEASAAGLPQTIVDVIIGQALSAGATVEQVGAVTGSTRAPAVAPAAMAHAARAEQFALDHLIGQYSEGLKGTIDVSDEMISQAASLGLELLNLADEAQSAALEVPADRSADSYGRALDLVADAVSRRYRAPLGDGDGAQDDWRTSVVTEAVERMYGIECIAAGVLPAPEAERGTQVDSPAADGGREDGNVVNVPMFDTEDLSDEPAGSAADSGPGMPGGELVPVIGLTPDDPAFVAPDESMIGRLRELCVSADVMSDPHAIGTWLETKTGSRVSRAVHAPVLEQFVEFYEQAGPGRVRADVLAVAEPAA